IGIVAQRLVRVTCSHCGEAIAPTDEEAVALGMPLEALRAHTLKRGTGCLQCRQTGYAGRDGVFQIMPISERLRGLIGRQSAAPEIFTEARGEGMRTLREAAIEKVLHGVTTVAEMVRVTGSGQ